MMIELENDKQWSIAINNSKDRFQLNKKRLINKY